jgi:hypothetical protein
MNPKPVVALLGAAPGAGEALVRALTERLAQSGIDGACAPEFVFGLPAVERPSLTLLLASDAPTQDPGLRSRLARERIAYSVLHGDAAMRLDAAWQLLRSLLRLAPEPGAAQPSRRSWSWACDKCSDPVCEHRLFQDLIASRHGDSAIGQDPTPDAATPPAH